MKKYYQTLNKEKKKEINDLYQKEYKKSDLQVRFTRLNIYAITGYVSGLLVLILAFCLEESKLGSIITACTLFVTSTVFLIGKYLIKLNVLNKIALKNK